ncbi:hypothetical protein [Sphingomonas sp. GC_Shp_6]|uniref:hypothetical protein n=1 Tax=Sphingomonas sp. GC_Shp_6 TaxID=2937378 RepID=UPI00226AD766|nr:hypothetical protein [Sphingomonas sp. GC_Shp_6]
MDVFERLKYKEIAKPKYTAATERQCLSPQQIYTLLDSRARDWRQILLAMLAACVALVVAAVNAMDFVKPLWIPLIFGGIAIVIFLIAIFLVLPEIQETRRRAEIILTYYITNWDKVPPVDGAIPKRLSKTPWRDDISRSETSSFDREVQVWTPIVGLDVRAKSQSKP